MAALRTLVWTIVFYAGSLLIVLGGALALLFPATVFRATVRLWARWHRWCARWLLGQRVILEGDLPGPGYLYAFKHEAMFETIDLPVLLDNPVVFAKEELARIPLWGVLARRYGLIFIARDAGARTLRQMLDASRAAIAARRPLVLMAEGTRVPHGQSPPLKSGFAGIYKLLGLPVVPVAVDSARLRRGWIRLPGTITYRVGAIIPAGLPRAEAEAQVHAAINVLNIP